MTLAEKSALIDDLRATSLRLFARLERAVVDGYDLNIDTSMQEALLPFSLSGISTSERVRQFSEAVDQQTAELDADYPPKLG